jgi:chromosome segregation ATPase
MTQRNSIIGLAAASGAVAVLALAACASNPVPDEKIAVAHASLQHAEQAGAQQAAPVEMQSANEKLQRAEDAARKHKGQDAIALADQANVDAQLAEATAQQKRAQQAASQLDQSLAALRQQAQSAPPPAPAPAPQQQMQ